MKGFVGSIIGYMVFIGSNIIIHSLGNVKFYLKYIISLYCIVNMIQLQFNTPTLLHQKETFIIRLTLQ